MDAMKMLRGGRSGGCHGAMACEALEARMVMSWSGAESALLELVNRARLDPVAEGVRLGIDLEAGLTASERLRLRPTDALAFDSTLADVARGQAAFVAAEGAPTVVGPNGESVTTLAKDLGYAGSAGAVAGIELGSLDQAAIEAVYAGWMADVDTRKSLLGLFATFSESLNWDGFGAGLVEVDGSVHVVAVLGFPGSDASARFVGAAFDDVNADGFAELDELRERVQVDVTPAGDPNRLAGSAVTEEGGAWSIALADGDYDVRFTDLSTGLVKRTSITVAGENVKLDVLAAEIVEDVAGSPLDRGRVADGTRPVLAETLDPTVMVAFLNRNDDAAVLTREGDGYRLELAGTQAGAPALSGAIEAWRDTRDGLIYAAAPSSVGLILLRQDASGAWSFRNLSTELDGAGTAGIVVTRSITAFADNAGLRYVAGLTDSGEVVLFAQTGRSNQDQSLVWTATNLSTEHLALQGQATPAFAGELISFVTPWNALNVAGLDDAGRVRAVWFGPGRTLWSAADLSTQTGAPVLVGGLTAWLTGWNAMNIAGIDADGNLSAVWWVPGGDGWRQTDLTATIGGPELSAGSVTSFVTTWGAMNVVGVDGAGRVVVYWWVPNNGGWQIADLTTASGSDAGVFGGGLRAGVSVAGEMSVVGARATGDVSRLSWTPGERWMLEDVTGLVL